MTRNIEIENLHCLCCRPADNDRIAYVIYPMDMLSAWIETAATRFDTAIVVITGMDWQDAMSPWPAKGVPRGCPDFKGEAPEFLRLLSEKVIPRVEQELGFASAPRRTLVGVSMSGLFALWQWMLCDTFNDIASLSGSFWYDGFIDWIKGLSIPRKQGKAFFLLGDREAASRVKAFEPVARNTQEIISILNSHGIATEFRSVPGNHYDNPIPRLDTALAALAGMEGDD